MIPQVLEVLQRVGHVFRFDFELVVLGVHEHVHWIGEVRKSHFLLVEQHLLELVVGAVDGFAGSPGQQVLQLHLDDGGVAAGLVVLGLLDDERVGTHHDDVAGAEFLCGFHAVFSKLMSEKEKRRIIPLRQRI